MRQATIHHKQGGGEQPAAFFTDKRIPWSNPYGVIFIRIHFGCNGLPIGHLKTWYRFSFEPWAPGDPTSITSYGFIRGDKKQYYGMIVDVRTPEQMMRDCCPPAIHMEFAGMEGVPS